MPAPARVETAERCAAATRATIRQGRDQAFYDVEADRVQLLLFENFVDVESYYATLLREMTHWMMQHLFLAREFGRRRCGEDYAAEELLAELGAAILYANPVIMPEPRPDRCIAHG